MRCEWKHGKFKKTFAEQKTTVFKKYVLYIVMKMKPLHLFIKNA